MEAMADPPSAPPTERSDFSLLRHREEILTLPNSLTLVRLPLAAVVWLAPSNARFVLAMVVIAGLTDVFDGRVARYLRRRRSDRGQDTGRLGESDAIGAWLDPVCDKIFVASVVAALTVGFGPPIYAVLLLATREVLLVPVVIARWSWRWFREKVPVDFRAGISGKATTAAQFAGIVSIVLWPPGVVPFAAVAGALGVVAVVVYVRRGLLLAHHTMYNPIGMAVGRRKRRDSDATGD